MNYAILTSFLISHKLKNHDSSMHVRLFDVIMFWRLGFFSFILLFASEFLRENHATFAWNFQIWFSDMIFRYDISGTSGVIYHISKSYLKICQEERALRTPACTAGPASSNSREFTAKIIWKFIEIQQCSNIFDMHIYILCTNSILLLNSQRYFWTRSYCGI